MMQVSQLSTTRGLVRVGCGVSTAVLGVVVVFWVWGGVWVAGTRDCKFGST